MSRSPNFSVYRSSAGSGKTFTLVSEYIKLAIKSPDNFRHVLAITFTNKAANEMKERVIQYLKGLSEYEPETAGIPVKSLMEMLTKDSGQSVKEVSEQARLVLTRIIHQYSDFAIGTIDSFVHRLIRTFARDLSLPMNFEVELDGDALLQKAVEQLISKVGNDEKLTRILVNFIESKSEEEGHWDIEKDLLDTATVLLKEDGQIFIDLLKDLDVDKFISIRKELNQIIFAFEEALRQLATEAITYAERESLTTDHLTQGSKGIMSYFNYIAKSRFDKLEPSKTVKDIVAQGKVLKDKLPASISLKASMITNDIIDFYLKISDLRQRTESKWHIAALIRQKLFQIAVLNELRKIIDEFRESDNIMHISEFNRRVAQIVLEQSAPFIYERVGERYTNYLIDEFQDTSILQWQNLIPLLVNSMASGGFNLIVGDAKQAIYRWRSGELEQFQMLPQIPGHEDPIIKEREMALRNNFSETKLLTNFRSCRQIVSFNNRFFTFISQFLPPDYLSVYSDVNQTGRIEGEGYIKIEFIDSSLSKEERSNINCSHVLEIVRDYQERNQTLRGVAVLCRTNDAGSLISRFLMSQGINVISSESLLLSASTKVNLILSVLKYLHNPSDQISLSKILEYLINSDDHQKSDLHEALRMVNSSAGKSFTKDFIEQRIGIQQLDSGLFSLQGKPLFDRVEGIVKVFGLNEPPDPYVVFFQDVIWEQSGKGITNTDDLMEWWGEKQDKLSVVVPEGLDAVQVLTIHKAKGLQFPVVIYPFANASLRPAKSEFWIEPELDEIPELRAALIKNDARLEQTIFRDLRTTESNKSLVDLLNLLYVVLTRPEKELYVISESIESPSGIPSSVPGFLSAFLQSEYPENQSGTYEFGSLTHQSETTKTGKISAIKLNKQFTEDWSKKFRIRLNAPSYWNTEDSDQKRKFGNIVHKVLSELKDAAGLDEMIKNLLNSGTIDEEEASRVKYMASSMLNDEDMKRFFSHEYEILNEAEILTSEGFSYRPDRLLIKGKEVIIIDFKTGNRNHYHEEQINGYARILIEMGFMVKGKFLIYLNEKAEILEVP